MMLPSAFREPSGASNLIDAPGATFDEGSDEPSFLDGIIGGGPVPALYEAFSHYTDGEALELPDSDITGPQGADDDDDLFLSNNISSGPTLEMF